MTWLDLVTCARTNLADFQVSDSAHGKICRVWIKGGQIEISEDDYRLIMSGAPERMIPNQPIPDDESSELCTMNILDSRLNMLIKKADSVASKARQLKYHLSLRKSAVLARKSDVPNAVADAAAEGRVFSPQPFPAMNNRIPKASSSDNPQLQQELLEQFLSIDRQSSVGPRPRASRGVTTDSGPHSGFNGEGDARRLSHPVTSSEDGSETQLRVLMAAKIEKLARGDIINPPCDRCRRLRFDCTKHLTACSACTKKHAKCSWKELRDVELDGLLGGSPQPPRETVERGNEFGFGKIPYNKPAEREDEFGFGQLSKPVMDPFGFRAGLDYPIRDQNSPPAGVSAPTDNNLGSEQRKVPGPQSSLRVMMDAERRAESSNEHAILTQIATAAAAAGH